jgi:hypothetical protein
MTLFSFNGRVHSLAFAVGTPKLDQTVRLIGRNVTAIAADAANLDFIGRRHLTGGN